VEFNTQQKYGLLSKMGYTGPSDPKMMDAFLASSPSAAARMGKLSRAAQKMTVGNTNIGMSQGGVVGMNTGGLAVSSSHNGGRMDDRVYSYFVVDGTGKKVSKNYPTQEQAQAELQRLSSAPPATSTTTTPTAGTTTTASPNPAVIVYGPDGTQYSSPAAAKAAGVTNYSNTNPLTDPATPTQTKSDGTRLTEALIQDPSKLTTTANVAPLVATPEQFISGNVGQVGQVQQATTTTTGPTQTAAGTTTTPTNTMTAATSAGQVAEQVAGVQAAQGQITQSNLVDPAQQTESVVSQFQAAQGAGILMNNPMQREIQEGEIVSGSAVDATKVESMLSSIQAAEATPSKMATVQGQLEGLLQQFEGGETPAWAAGAMRAAQNMLVQRGLGASSIAGQAIIQAAMESALPIAQVDAATRAQFESQNLSNRQQTALFAAQQRAAFLQQDFDQAFQTRVLNAAKVSDIANMNFTAEQQIALENSRIVNTVNLANLENRQAMTLAQVAALANLELTNLNNRQQAAVQNAQAFLQMDLTNLSNAQQTEMFRAQSNVQALFTDQAAENAARQFNAASKNQTDQFFADLANRVSMFNSEQQNAMAQFNAGETNATSRFNSQLEAQRQQFNAQNSLIIAQANAQWRQNIATQNTVMQHEANMEAAKAQNAMTAKALDEVWQKERDTLAYAFTAIENEAERALKVMLMDKEISLEKYREKQTDKRALGTLFAQVIGIDKWGL
jgi:hypothetical protein